jgi:trigger factor
MAVTTSVEPLEGNKVKLHVAIPAADFERAIDAAFRKLAHEVKLPGFRPG